MSGLARLFLAEGKEVSGSDREESQITKALQEEGVTFFETQVAENITDATDLVVYTAAMPKDHEELVRAEKLGIKMLSYFEALGFVANEYHLIAVAGTHGKTTTTAMLIDIFESAGFDPSAIVGSLRAKTKSNYRAGKSKYFIVEACEYKRDFLSLTPDVLVITNIEHDHVDYYKTLDDVNKAFRELVEQVREGGTIIANLGDENVKEMLEGATVSIVDYSKFFNPLRKLKIPGVHNQMNAAAAIAAASNEGIAIEDAECALAGFVGAWRRFEFKGEVNGAKVYDDYAHHPTEIKAAITGAKELYPDRKIVTVFQSHTYTRTHELFDGFVESLSIADSVYVLPIYAAREENVSGVTHYKLAEEIAKTGTKAEAVDFDGVEQELRDIANEDMVIITMGAGENNKISDSLVL